MHINGRGIGWIAADLDQGQAKGLGLFLSELDPTKEWHEHLALIFVACRVHYERTVQQTGFSDEIKMWMKSIPHATSVEEVKLLMRKIRDGLSVSLEDLEEFKVNENEETISGKKTVRWVKFYKRIFVLAALCSAMSKIPPALHEEVPTSTNRQEASHADRNRDGKHLSLLQAINIDERYDVRRFAELEKDETLGVAGLSGRGEARRATANFRRKEGERQKKIEVSMNKKPKKTTQKSRAKTIKEPKASRLQFKGPPSPSPTQSQSRATGTDAELEELEKQVALVERKAMLRRKLAELQQELNE